MTTSASVSKKGKHATKTNPKPNNKHQYGVGTEWNTPSDSHHLILHLRIQPSARAAANHPAAPEAFPGKGGGDAATFKELLKYRPELGVPPEAYEQLGSDSYPYRFESPSKEASAELSAQHHYGEGGHCGGAPENVVLSPTYDKVTGRRISTAPATLDGSTSSTSPNSAAVPGHVHGRIVPVPSSVRQLTELDLRTADDVCPPGGGGLAADVPTVESVHHPVLHCWWCTCPFQWTPYAIPLARERTSDKYETTGTFCSPECCAAYIFGGNTRCGGGRQTLSGDPWKQYEMLHRMVTKMVTKVTVRIKLAPPRETLQKFGGPYTVDEYRRILNDYRVDVRITMPPVNPLNGVTEEIPVDYVQQKKKFVPIDSSRVEKATNELRLKRKKKQAEENTLETFMQLRISS